MTCWRHLWRKCKVWVMVAVTEVRTTMVPSEDVLPDVLPTERLTATGMAAPELRAELRKIDDVRNVGSVLVTWAHEAVTIDAHVWSAHTMASPADRKGLG